jgi:hypothetical protein
MGQLASKCFNVFNKDKICDISKDDDDNDNDKINEDNTNSKKIQKKNNMININDVLIQSKTITKDKTQNNNDDILKIQKIQNSYHKHYLKKKFETEIKPSLSKKERDYINKLYTKLSSYGDITANLNQFDENGWKRYYPSEDQFFLYPKGEVYNNQIRIKNKNDIKNIEIYEGEINYKNMKHGNGILTTSKYIMKGTWRNDQFTGWGIKCLRNGDIYESRFINGELNGKGIFKNGKNIYEGEFINGERHGYGDFTTETYHYKGEFKNNKMDGKGEIDFYEDSQRYEGTFSENNITGKGIYKWKNGDIYEGYMKNGKRNGKGKYTQHNGKIYEGEYINDIQEGKGKLIYPEGKTFEGNFVNGKLDGEVLYTENDKTNKVIFSKGKLINSK